MVNGIIKYYPKTFRLFRNGHLGIINPNEIRERILSFRREHYGFESLGEIRRAEKENLKKTELKTLIKTLSPNFLKI